MSKALYRKYRSKSLDEIVGQEHITAILKRAIEQDKVAHAYLLTGPRGVGKTSIARIMAHAINNLPYTEESQHLDIIEIDAASNNSVEDVRDLREKVQIVPISAKRKVYIIDEVHMLSKQAFNALLKTLEEPPAHIVFILATTDADKLPATIISRVQRFNFRAITPNDAVKHLKYIAKKENIAIQDDALSLIATHGKGSFRDSIGLLDQLQNLSDGTITLDMVANILGLADTETIMRLLHAYVAGDIQESVTLLDAAAINGTPAHVIAEQLIGTIRKTITTEPQYLPLLDALLDVPKSAWPEIKLLTALTSNTTPTVAVTTKPSSPIQKQTPSLSKPSEPRSVTSQGDTKSEVQPDTLPPKAKSVPARNGASGELTEKVASGESSATPKESRAATAKNTTLANVPFDWAAFTAAVKPKAAGAFIILKGCGYDYDGITLTVYAGKKFNKNKLDKALPDLSAVLSELGMAAELTITDTTKPPKDATTAAILAMMGGGEELRAPTD